MYIERQVASTKLDNSFSSGLTLSFSYAINYIRKLWILQLLMELFVIYAKGAQPMTEKAR